MNGFNLRLCWKKRFQQMFHEQLAPKLKPHPIPMPGGSHRGSIACELLKQETTTRTTNPRIASRTIEQLNTNKSCSEFENSVWFGFHCKCSKTMFEENERTDASSLLFLYKMLGCYLFGTFRPSPGPRPTAARLRGEVFRTKSEKGSLSGNGWAWLGWLGLGMVGWDGG